VSDKGKKSESDVGAGAGVYCVGYAHLDPVYMWRWQEGVAEGRATLRAAVNLLREHPGAKFMTTTAWLFRQVAAVDPELIAEVRELVRAGRWDLAGGMWVEADVNVPGGESLVRQVLLGQRTFLELFGVRAGAGANPDSFGHCEGLPQILRRAGMDGYVFMRPFRPDRPIPGGAFLWEGPDGSRVRACRLPTYGSGPEGLGPAFARAEQKLKDGESPVLLFYGVGNHGGGPTRENIRAVEAYAADHPEHGVRFSGLAEFFAAAGESELPVRDGGLLHWGRGCYSNRSEMKALCRQAEIALTNAERLGACVETLCGRRVDPGRLREGWERLLFNQFHDIISGTSIRESARDDRDAFGLALTVAEEEYDAARGVLASMADTGGDRPEVHTYSGPDRHLEYAGGVPLVLVNHQCWDYSGPVEVELHDWRGEPAACVDPEGGECPVQIGPGSGYPGSLLRRQLATFNARIPAGGFAVYTVHRRTAQEPREPVGAGGAALENDLVKVSLDPGSGCIDGIEDRAGELRLDFSGRGNDLVVMADASDTWGINADGRDAGGFSEQSGRFTLRAIHVQEQGPVRATLRISREFDASRAEQFVTLFAGSPVVRVRTRLFWNEPKCVLKASFPVALAGAGVWAEIPAGASDRGTAGGEWPCQRWVDVGGELEGRSCGLALVNDSKQAYDFEGGCLRLTLVRSPNWAFMYNNQELPDRHYRVQDLGYHEFTYWLRLHPGDWREAHVPQLAETLNNPPAVLPEHCHSGKLGRSGAMLRSSAPNVTVGALKRSEDGRRWILRTFETEGREADVTVNWEAAGMSVDFRTGPFEIRTFALDSASGGIVETDLVEEPLGGGEGVRVLPGEGSHR
jgi:alpha-mannosidase